MKVTVVISYCGTQTVVVDVNEHKDAVALVESMLASGELEIDSSDPQIAEVYTLD